MRPSGPAIPVEALTTILGRANKLGFVGRVPPGDLLAHARGFALGVDPPGSAVDLGSGAGLPGLVLAFVWPETRWLLIDAGERRATFLDQAVLDLGLTGRVVVEQGRAEDLARSERRGQYDLVVARSFAPPAVTAECACGFLRTGGWLVVSEPPTGSDDRWEPLTGTPLGLVVARRWTSEAGTYVALEQTQSCPDGFPRRAGLPAKRPLF